MLSLTEKVALLTEIFTNQDTQLMLERWANNTDTLKLARILHGLGDITDAEYAEMRAHFERFASEYLARLDTPGIDKMIEGWDTSTLTKSNKNSIKPDSSFVGHIRRRIDAMMADVDNHSTPDC